MNNLRRPAWAALAGLLALVLALGSSVPAGQAQTTGSAKVPRFAGVTDDLADLYASYQQFLAGGGAGVAAAFAPESTLARINGDRVVVDAVAVDDAEGLRRDLEALGMVETAVAGRVVSGQLPLAAIADLARIEGLAFARPSYALTRAGNTTSQGDRALAADTVRANLGLDGSGVTVGVLSDSYNCRGGAAADVASGDLPAGVLVLKEYTVAGCSDEGRAMMQIIHDVAPGAKLQFYTAFGGVAGFAGGIRALAAAGSDIIVDDVIYPAAEPMFQDGLVAQAVDEVVADGVVFFSAAGNYGRDAYESAFRPGGDVIINIDGDLVSYTAHDFDPGAGVDRYQQVTVAGRGSLNLVLQWDSPAGSVAGSPGSANDVDILLLDGNTIVDSSIFNNLGKDPVEVLEFFNSSSSPRTFNIFIGKYNGESSTPDPGYLKYVLLRLDGTINEYFTNSGTIYGHSNAAGALAVGAAFWNDTPAFGTSPALLEDFSSAGPTPIFFTPSGSRKATETRQKPSFVAPDGVNTTFFGSDSPSDPDTFGNFFGTSAAAPHAAGVAALLLEAAPGLTPDQVFTALSTTTGEMGAAGYDFDTGHGFIRAPEAVASVLADLVVAKAAPALAVTGSPITYTITVTNTGAGPAASVVLADNLPAGLSFVSAQASNGGSCSHSSGSVSCALGSIAAGVTVTARLVALPSVSGPLTNTVSVSSGSFERSAANNSGSATTRVYLPGEIANLAISLRGEPEKLLAGEMLTYTLTVSNVGALTASGVTVTHTLPAGATFVSAEGAGWSCGAAAGVVTCTRPSLGITTAPPISIRAVAPLTVGNAVGKATVSAGTPDPFPDNNSATAMTRVLLPPVYLPLIAR